MSLLHVFDMDGTLLRGTTASMQLAGALGFLPQLQELETSFAQGTVDTREFAAASHGFWSGLTADTVTEVFGRSPWIAGISDVLTDIRERGEFSIVITMSPNFYADLLLTMGADEVHSSRFPALPMAGAPHPAAILAPADKVTIVDAALERRDLGRDRCIAYGDSGSDIPLFRVLRHTVAVNATAALKDLAALSYDGADLRPAYAAARAHLASAGRSGQVS